MVNIIEKDGAVFVCVRLQPKSSQNKIIGIYGDGQLKIKLTAPPVDNAANLALISFMAKILKTAKSNIEIVKGLTSREKTLRINGADLKTIKTILENMVK
ncbi:MAG: DUF167 domain-containing protein [Candidatus Margulisiibacteriota bacterium]